MKTVVIWEESDIKRGIRVTKVDEDPGYMIGRRESKPSGYYCLVSLADGEIGEDLSEKQMAKLLTDNGFIPVEHHDICEECGR